jgi:hypothetical protein
LSLILDFWVSFVGFTVHFLSILTHTSKILTKIILRQIEKKIDENLAEDQFVFLKNRGTREAILCLRNILEKSFKVNRKVKVKVKQFHYRPGVAQRVPGS